jgi:hypothetical protein
MNKGMEIAMEIMGIPNKFEKMIQQAIGQFKMMLQETGEIRTVQEWKEYFTDLGENFSLALVSGRIR